MEEFCFDESLGLKIAMFIYTTIIQSKELEDLVVEK
jgi:hypothetical protein